MKQRPGHAARALGLALALGICAPASARGQGLDPFWGDGATMDLGAEGTLRLTGFGRAWLTVSSPNPPPADPRGGQDHRADVGLREARLLVLAQPLPALTLALGGGTLDLAAGAPGTGFQLTDAWVDVAVAGDAFHVGAGLHPWAGLARASTVGGQAPLGLEPLALARPFQLAGTDAFDRRLGGFAHGRIGGFGYRLGASQTRFGTDAAAPSTLTRAALDGGRRWFGEARVTYAFRAPPDDVTPYRPGSWLGSEQALVVGVGGAFQPDGARQLDPDTGPRDDRHDVYVLAADVFAEQPLSEGAALTLYGLYLYEDLGPNALRMLGAFPRGPPGGGQAFVFAGTGHHAAAMVGLVLPGRFWGTRVQPFGKATLSLLDAVDDPVLGAEAGVTWHLFEPYLRLTAAWRLRALLGETGEAEQPATVAGLGHEAILQVLFAY